MLFSAFCASILIYRHILKTSNIYYDNADPENASILGYNKAVMVLVGLTGNYGMGKSSVLGFFEESGAVTISCDAIVSRLLEDKDVIRRIREICGDEVVAADGGLDRKTVACRVFSDPEQRKRLEGFLHPMVFAEIDAAVDNRAYASRVVVVEVPLLFESSTERRFQKTITVHATDKEAVRRLKQKGVSRGKALARLKAQMPIEEKISRSDFTIDNSGNIDETKKQAGEIYKELMKLSRTS